MDATRVQVYTWADLVDGMALVVCALDASLMDDKALVPVALANMERGGTSAWGKKQYV